MQRYGSIGQAKATIFYSIRANTSEAMRLRDNLKLQGNAVSDVLPERWFGGARNVGGVVNPVAIYELWALTSSWQNHLM